MRLSDFSNIEKAIGAVVLIVVGIGLGQIINEPARRAELERECIQLGENTQFECKAMAREISRISQ